MPDIKRHVLVTGASSGIGAAISSRLLAQGWRVTGVARRETAQPNSDYVGLCCDLADERARNQLLARVGKVDAFVHAAGFLTTGNLGVLEFSAHTAMWQLHVAAAEQIANNVLKDMGQGARIVLIGSRTAAGSAGRSQYAATKAALVAMARSWAIELAPRGITVNVVAPAATDTPMLHDPARRAVEVRVPPIGRYIRPAEVAGAVAFLLSPDADAITGQVLTICGGASL